MGKVVLKNHIKTVASGKQREGYLISISLYFGNSLYPGLVTFIFPDQGIILRYGNISISTGYNQ